jgi:hypothetical protein
MDMGTILMLAGGALLLLLLWPLLVLVAPVAIGYWLGGMFGALLGLFVVALVLAN